MTTNSFNCPNELLLSVMTNDSKTVDSYLQRGINPTQITQTGLTLLGLAARQGCIDVLRCFLDYCKNSTKRVFENELDFHSHDLTPDGMNELQWDDEIPTSLDSTENEWTLLFRYYIKIIETTEQFLNTPSVTIKMDPDTLDSHSMAPIHHAAINGKLECVELLIKSGCSVNTETREGYTALHLAGEHKNIIELLLRHHANPNKCSYLRQETPLMLAAKKGDVEWMKLLIEYGANINSFNYSDQSPLILAVANNQCEAVQFLLEKKCGLNEIDSDGLSAITYAIKLKNKDILKLLLKNGARLHPIKNSLQKYLRLGLNDTVRILIEAGANPNLRSNEMWTPLHVAVKYGDYEIIEYLLDVGHARLGQSLYGDCKEIHLLMTRRIDRVNFLKILNLFFENGISLDDQSDHYSKTPLEIAFISRNCAAIEILLQQGANINSLPSPETLDYLQENNFTELANLVILSGYKKSKQTNPLSLKEMSRIVVRNSVMAQIKMDQKYFTLLGAVRNGSFIESYLDKLFLPVSLKSYLCKFDDLNLEFESNYWPSDPIETFHFSLRNN